MLLNQACEHVEKPGIMSEGEETLYCCTLLILKDIANLHWRLCSRSRGCLPGFCFEGGKL